MKQSGISGHVAKSIWKTDKSNAEPKQKSKSGSGQDTAPFIPKNYSDPTASAALRNLIREEKQQAKRLKIRHST